MSKNLIGLLLGSVFIFLLLPEPSVAQAVVVRRDFGKEARASAFLAQLPTPSTDSSTVNSTSAGPSSSLATIISFLSLGVSAAVAYFSNFRQAKIGLLFSRNIVFFSLPGAVAGVGFNIPITFYNWSPQGGTIHRIRLVVSRQGQDDCYDMAWTTFVKIGAGGIIEDADLAQPIPVEGRSSVNKFIRFDWTSEDGGKQFDVQSGKYELDIYTWVSEAEKPNFHKKLSFVLKEEAHLKKYRESVAKNTDIPIWISLNENENPNQVLTKNTVDRLYSSKK
jgi:hypothetical protein